MFAVLDNDGNVTGGIASMPQSDGKVWTEIADDDPRIAVWRNRKLPEQMNQQSVIAKVSGAIPALESADANWEDLKAAQKDVAMRLAIRAVAKLGRLAVSKLDGN